MVAGVTSFLRSGGFLVAGIVVALVGGAALAHPTHDPRTELFVALIVQAGCQMSHAVADQEMPKYGFTKGETRDIVTDLLMAGEAMIDPAQDTLILMTRECSR